MEIQVKKREALITDPVEAAHAAMDSARHAREVLKIYKTSGLRNTPENDSELERLFGPALSLELFRNYIESNPASRLQFVWDSEPFGKEKAAQAQREVAATHMYEAFCEAAKLASVSGQANVAPNVANFGLIRNRINEPATVQRIVEALTNGSVKGLAPNDEETIREWRRDSDTKERLSLCKELAAYTCRGEYAINEETNKLFASRYNTTESIRDKVKEIREAKRLRALSPEELKAEIRRGQPAPTLTTPVLPEEITPSKIKAASPEQIKFWRARFGSAALDARLQGN